MKKEKLQIISLLKLTLNKLCLELNKCYMKIENEFYLNLWVKGYKNCKFDTEKSCIYKINMMGRE